MGASVYLLGTPICLAVIPDEKPGQVVLKRIMVNRDPISFPKVLFVHNLALCLFSLITFIGATGSVLNVFMSRGWMTIWADKEVNLLIFKFQFKLYSQWELPQSRVPFWCYVFYVSKYYELLDTAFLVLKKRPVQTVQVLQHWCF